MPIVPVFFHSGNWTDRALGVMLMELHFRNLCAKYLQFPASKKETNPSKSIKFVFFFPPKIDS